MLYVSIVILVMYIGKKALVFNTATEACDWQNSGRIYLWFYCFNCLLWQWVS